MDLINFKDLPDTTTPINATNLNNNFNELDDKIEELKSLNFLTGVETALNIKINSKTVYAKLVEVGKLPNNSEITINVGFNTSNAQLISSDIYTLGSYQQSLPSNSSYCLLGPNGLIIGTSSYYSDYDAQAIIYYIYK